MSNPLPSMLGHYQPGNTLLHRVDPRSKLLPVAMLMVLGLLTESIHFYLVSIILLIGGLFMSGIGPDTIWRSLRPIIFLIAFTVAYHLIFSSGDGTIWITIFGWSITYEALSNAGFFSSRLLLFVSSAFFVTLTSSPSELAESLASILSPLRKLRVPVDDLSLILFIALRFIPILYSEFEMVHRAQIIRGVDFKSGFVRRIRNSIAILIPVLVGAINRADDLALAMEARGYRPGKPRTLYTRVHFGVLAWTFMLASSSSLIGLFLVVG